MKLNAKEKLSNVFNVITGKKGIPAAIFGGLSLAKAAGTVGAGIAVAAGVLAVPPVAIPLMIAGGAAETAFWAGASHLAGKRHAKKKSANNKL